ncbi:methyl-accepting chemotaxis protein [Halobacteriovorax sp. HFRX-2_2]|uniref:methyl-accepting chemotaxis protein n=1 Tax=unclassified Halobacteriovorax TaxID=2639665 RepID=UPI00371539BC
MSISKFSLNKKLVLGFLLAGLLPSLTITFVVLNNVDKTLHKNAENMLISIREGRSFQLEELYKTMGGQVSALAQNISTIDAARQFKKSFQSFEIETRTDFNAAKSALTSFYANEFGGQYNKTNIGKEFDRTSEIIRELSKNELLLQDAFISSNNNPLGSKDALVSLKDGTNYSKTHERYHDAFRTYLNKFGYYDIFLIDAQKAEVIYSVFKEADFATNLKTGPYASSGLAQAYNLAVNAKSKDAVFFTDIQKYYPSYESPAQFISAPIFENDKLSAVLVFQVPVAKINQILTSDEKWKEQGQGDSGETYIIGKDKVMRSVSRTLVEDEANFFKTMQKVGLSESAINYMKSKKTSALAAKIDTLGADNVVLGKTGAEIFEDYRDINVISAYKPLSIAGLDWYILSEMDEDEALASLYTVRKVIMTLITISGIAILLLALTFAKTISNSLVKLAEGLKLGAHNVLNSANALAQSSSDLSSATEQQAASLQETSASITEISAMVDRNSENANTTSDLSEKSQAKAQEGKEYVSSVKHKIEDIHKNNEVLIQSVEENNVEIQNITKVIDEISEKTKVINDIVFQTKLLSFNASVEAARAGEHGKGFAVVAEEVGALAAMSGTAAQEITELLERSIGQVHRTVENSKSKMSGIIEHGKKSVDESLVEIKTCDSVLSEILESFNEVNSSVRQIAASSTEQSAGVNEITTAVQQLDAVTQQNTSVAHTSSSKAAELKEQSNDLSRIVEDIQMIVFGENISDAQPVAASPVRPVIKMPFAKKKKNLELVDADSISADDSRFKDVI